MVATTDRKARSPEKNSNIPAASATAIARSQEPASSVPNRTLDFAPPGVLSPAYLEPKSAILSACGGGGPNSTYLSKRAPQIQRLYHLATASIGSFNADTSGFYNWVVDNCSQGFADDELAQHIRAQVLTAINEPNSEIGLRIRQIEAGRDSLFSESGPDTYWEFLLDPYFLGTSRAGRERYALIHVDFERAKYGYVAAKMEDERRFSDFGGYLVDSGFVEKWFGSA